MTRYRAVLTYDGTAYMGFQRQGDVPTIQLMLENAIQSVTGQSATVIGAGRTDTGVHATGQVVAFDVNWTHEDEALLRAINFHLPDDIALHAIRQQDGFHPRYDALARQYMYTIINTPNRHPLYRHSAWHLYGEISLIALQTVAPMLIGERDFKAFGHDPMKHDNTVREVFISEWSAEPIPDGVLLRYKVEANAFLYHMVRRMVSAQIAVGRGIMSVDEFSQIVADGAIEKVRQIAPPQGLVLEKVRYSDDNN